MSHKTITYQIEFFSYWHTSSGLSAGTSASLLVLRDEDNLPLIKGRTLKGLLRDAAKHIREYQKHLITDDFMQMVFGQGDDDTAEQKGKTETEQNGISKAACTFFTNASLSESAAEAIIKAKQTPQLYHTIASTKINAAGVAATNSLRTTEVTIPLTLYAQIDNFPDDSKSQEQLERCFQWIKRMGFHRNRGLGTCQFSIKKS